MKRFDYRLDKVLWAIIGFLPLVVYALMSIRGSVDFSSYIVNFDFGFVSDLLEQLPITLPTTLVTFLSWYASVEIAHVFYDCVVFIPRIAHNFAEGFYNEK